MIVKISGKLLEKRDQSVVLDVNGLGHEVLVPTSVLERIDQSIDDQGCVSLVTYYYLQIGPASGAPMLIGFLNDLEKDFFLNFIKVSGIGPRAAVRAFNRPLAEITEAINNGDLSVLKTLPGIGAQRAKEIVAKLQGKIDRFGLIQDRSQTKGPSESDRTVLFQREALDILLQLQYRKQEAQAMIDRAVEQVEDISSVEDLLNEIYKQSAAGPAKQ